MAPTVRLTRIRGASLGAPLGGMRVVCAWGARVYRRFARQRVAAVSAQNLFLLPLAHALARRTGAVFAYNAHELETETVGSAGLRQRLQRVIERHYIRRADVVSVVNESIAQWYREAYPGVDPVVVTNAPTGTGGVIDLRARLGIPEGELLYLHSGYLAPGRNIPLILRAFAQVGSHVVFVGEGALLDEVERAAAAHPTIHRLPPVEPDQVLAMTRGADVALCLIESGCLSHRLSTPNKMMEAFAAGTPALCSRPARGPPVPGRSGRHMGAGGSGTRPRFCLGAHHARRRRGLYGPGDPHVGGGGLAPPRGLRTSPRRASDPSIVPPQSRT